MPRDSADRPRAKGRLARLLHRFLREQRMKGMHDMLVIKNASVYAPEHLGLRDLLVAGDRIVAMAERIDEARLPVPCAIIDAAGRRTTPGLIDGHVHLTGGGGEGGFGTRTPEMPLSAATLAGVTTVVGVLGTDGLTRSPEALVAKVYALREEGLSAWCFTGSYRVPPVTVTGDVTKDIMMIEPVIGVGEVAVSDHRSSKPTDAELSRLASQARLGGMLSGKAGLVNVHLGDAQAGFGPLERAVAAGDLPRTQFLPTHCNRNPRLMAEALDWARAGGRVDFTASTTAAFLAGGETSAAAALAAFLGAGAPLSAITVTSDGQGSLPRFDADGRLCGLEVGGCASLLSFLREGMAAGIVSFESMLAAVTENPARALGLGSKGRIEVGMDADMVVFDDGLAPAFVVARGRVMVADGRPLVLGAFEPPAGEPA